MAGAGHSEHQGSCVVAWCAAAFVAACLATIPVGIPVPNAAMIALGLAGVGVVLAARFDRAGRWNQMTWWPVALILAAMVVSVLRCQLPGLAVERSTGVGVFALVAIVVQVAAWSPRALTAVLWAAAAAMAAVALDIGWQKATGRSLFTGQAGAGGRLTGSQGNQNDLAVASLLAPLAIAALPAMGRRWWVAACALTAAVGGLPAVLSASRQAMLAWFIGVWGSIIPRAGRRRSVVAVVVMLLVVAGAVAFTPALQARARQTWREGVGIREPLTAYGVTLFVDHPVTGIGPGLFGQYYQRDARNGWSWRGTPLPKVGMPWVHSLPVEVLCELGVVGGLAFAAALVVAVRRAWRARLGSGLQGQVAVAVLAVLAAGFVAGLVDLTFIKDWVRCLFWLVLGLGLSCGNWPLARTGQS
jgi:hypothetical protein